MKVYAFVLAAVLATLPGSCAGFELWPWLSYSSATEASSLGINTEQNRFVNVPVGDSWTAGFQLRIPLGPAPDQRITFDWPRYPLPTIPVGSSWTPPPLAVGPGEAEKKPVDQVVDGLKSVEEVSWSGILKGAVVLALLLAVATAVKWWRRKNGSREAT